MNGLKILTRLPRKLGERAGAWQLARELARKVYRLAKKPEFAKDYGLKGQIQDAAGSSMHNIAEGFDSDMKSAKVANREP